MNHEEAANGMLTEKYLLSELGGAGREEFEAHYFDCAECAADLKAGAAMLEATRAELAAKPAKAAATEKLPWRFWRSLVNPAWMAPAFAACMAVMVYQSAFVIPGLKKQMARSNAPEMMNSVVLAGGVSRGGEEAKVSAAAGGSFLISADIPPVGNYAKYRCVLTAPSGKTVWQGMVTREQAKDAIEIRVPAAATEAGKQTLTMEGTREAGDNATQYEPVATQTFVLEIQR